MQNYQKALAKTASTLNQLGVYWFLEGGSCLGYIREGNVLLHDHDIDIGVYCNQKDIPFIISNFPVHKIFKYNNEPSNVAFYYGAFVDIFFFTDYGQLIVETMHNLQDETVRLYGYHPVIIKGGVKNAVFEGVEVKVLNNSVQYCEALYGKNYLIPDKNWNAWSDPPNIVSEVAMPSTTVSRFLQLRKLNDKTSLNSYLAYIYPKLYKTSRDCFDPSFDNGLAALVLFFHKYSLHYDDHTSFNYAQLLLKRLLENLQYNKFDLTFLYGYCGIGWIIEYACQNQLIKDENRDILKRIDQLTDFSVENKELTHDELIGIVKFKLFCRAGAKSDVGNNTLNERIIQELFKKFNELFILFTNEADADAFCLLVDVVTLLIDFCEVFDSNHPVLLSLTDVLNTLTKSDDEKNPLESHENTYNYIRSLCLKNRLLRIQKQEYRTDIEVFLSKHFLSPGVQNSLQKRGVAERLELARFFIRLNESGLSNILINCSLLLINSTLLTIQENDFIQTDLLGGFIGIGITLIDLQTPVPLPKDVFTGILSAKKRHIQLIAI